MLDPAAVKYSLVHVDAVKFLILMTVMIMMMTTTMIMIMIRPVCDDSSSRTDPDFDNWTFANLAD